MRKLVDRYHFSNNAYIASHGKAPRGTGHWAFLIENATVEIPVPEVYYDKVSAYQTDTIFWVPGVWTLTEAKKRAAVILGGNRVPECTVYVAP